MNTVGTAVTTTTKGFRSVLVTIYQNPIISKIIAIVAAVIVTFVLLAISRIIATFIKNKITRSFVAKGSKEVQNVSALIGDVIFYALAMLSFFISFSIVGMNIGLILGGISIGVGFAFRATLSNLISGIMIFTTKEYQPGSIISMEIDRKEVMGKIEEINMKDIIIRTFDFRRLVIPNAKFVNSAVKTYSLESVLKLDIEATVDIKDDIDSVLAKTKEKVNTYAFVKYPEYTQALVDSFNDKICKLKIEFCFDPNAGIPTDMMKSQVQAGLIGLYKEIEKK
ncbi:MAG: mechanosensitive ion channel domain-containing protein [Candidatus Absconditabacterales bacterium]